MEVRVLGPLQVAGVGREVDLRGERLRSLLGMLVRQPAEVVPGDTLIDALWGESPPPTARASLRMHVSRLRQHLDSIDGSAVDIVSQAAGYRLAIEPDAVDHVRFERLLGEARLLVDDGDAKRAVVLLRSTLGLWRGPAFVDVDVPMLSLVAHQLDAARLDALDLLFSTRLDLGESSELIGDLESVVDSHPEAERFTRHLMLALYRTGRQTDALATFQRLRRRLADGSGLVPSRELTELESSILRQDPSLDLTRRSALQRPPDVGREAVPATVPASLGAFRRGPFAGRARVVDDLAAQLGRSRSPAAGCFHCVLGPAGIGKSRLLAEIGDRAAAEGTTVLHGWAQPGVAMPFSVFRTAFAPLGRSDSLVGEAVRELLLLVDGGDQAIDRREFRLLPLLEAVVDSTSLERGTSTLLVLDDLQWADSVSLAGIHHLARRASPNLCLLVAARPGRPSTAWQDFIAELSTIPGAAVCELGGLAVDDVAELVAARHPEVPEHRRLEVAERLMEATDGNPYFVSTMLHDPVDRIDQRASTFDLDGPNVPLAARAALERRIDALPTTTQCLLRAAAVLGPQVGLDQLATVVGRGRQEVEGELAPAVQTGVVVHAEHSMGQLHFEHELLRRTLLDGLTPADRSALHRSVVATLGHEPADDMARAYHLYRALPLVDRGDVIVGLRRAVSRALDLTAWAEALLLTSAALELAREAGEDDAPMIIDLLVQRGRARMGLSGRPAAMRTFEEAFTLALDSGHREMVGDILSAATRFYASLTPGDPVLGLIDRVLADDARGALGLEVLAEVLGHRFVSEGATDEVVVLLDRLRAAAGDRKPAELLRAEVYLCAGQPDVAAGIEAADRLLGAIGADVDHPTLSWADGYLFRIGFELVAGDVRAAEADLSVFARGAARLRLPVFLWLEPVVRSDLALQAGRFEEAERCSEQAARFGAEHHVPDAAGSRTFHQFVTALLRGGIEGLVPTVDAAAAQFPGVLSYRAAQAAARAELGERQPAIEVLDRVIDDLQTSPRSLMTTLELSLAAWAALSVAPASTALRLLPLLEPWSGTVPRTAMVGASFGPIDRVIGRLQCLVGRRRAGLVRLERAVEQADSMGARPWSAWARFDLACELEDRTRSQSLVQEVRAEAEALGLAPLLARIDAAAIT